MAYTKTVWENLPSTNTPLNAENLNNIEDGIETLDTEVSTIDNRLSDEEVYKTATAGSNGDFHVTLTNTTLTNGRTVKISFPAATNGASNARLSIDGGTTYVNVFSDVTKRQRLASSIQSKFLELYYNGTNFVVSIPNQVIYDFNGVQAPNFTLSSGFVLGNTLTTGINFTDAQALKFKFRHTTGTSGTNYTELTADIENGTTVRFGGVWSATSLIAIQGAQLTLNKTTGALTYDGNHYKFSVSAATTWSANDNNASQLIIEKITVVW